MAGDVSATFESSGIRFHPAERTFRLVTGRRGRAAVRGKGLGAALATAVLEREGYTVGSGEGSDLTLTIDGDGTRWRVSAGDRDEQGSTFTALAELLRKHGESHRMLAEPSS